MSTKLKFARPVTAAFALIALLGVIPANAADVIGEEPPAPAAPMEEPPLNTWSGPYAGVSLGYGFSGRTDSVAGTVENRIGTDGFIGGGFAGYNFQAGNFVAGVEADANYSDLHGSNAGVSSKSGFDGSLRARLGYAVSPEVLLYTTAGGAGQRAKIGDAAGSDTQTLLGWTAGAGADVKVTEQVFVRGEYRYTDYGSETFNTGSGARSVDSRDNRITFGVGMKF